MFRIVCCCNILPNGLVIWNPLWYIYQCSTIISMVYLSMGTGIKKSVDLWDHHQCSLNFIGLCVNQCYCFARICYGIFWYPTSLTWCLRLWENCTEMNHHETPVIVLEVVVVLFSDVWWVFVLPWDWFIHKLKIINWDITYFWNCCPNHLSKSRIYQHLLNQLLMQVVHVGD